MNWIRIATKMKNDPRIGAIAAECKVRVHEAVGLVTCTLLEFPEHAREGDIATIGDLTIEQWAMWPGKVGTFAAAFRAHMCDPTAPNIVRSWERHNGAALRKAEADIERKRSGRRTDGDAMARERRANGARQPRGRLQVGDALSEVDETLRRQTAKSLTLSAAVVVTPPASHDPPETATATTTTAARETVLAQFENPLHRDAAAGYIRGAQHPDTVVAHLSGMISGLSAPGMQPVPPERLGEALHDMRVAGIARVTSSALAKFVDGVGRTSTIRPSGADGELSDAEIEADVIRRIQAGEFIRG